MKSINRRLKKTRTGVKSDYIAFVEAIKGQKFNRKVIRRNFIELVDRDDYDKADVKALIENLYTLSNPLVAC